MKAITKILTIVALVGCFLACSEDDYQPKTMELAFEVAGTACEAEQPLTNFTTPVTTIENNNEWISVTCSDIASGTPKARFSFVANPDLTKRTGIVKFISENGDTFIYTITQAEYVPCTLSANVNMAANKAQETVTLPGLPNAPATGSADVNWISNVKPVSSSEGYAVRFDIGENNNPGARSGKITVTSDHGDVYVITITQNGQPTALPGESNDEVSNNPAYSK